MKSLSAEEIAQKVEELPTLPSIVQELNNVISDPMSSNSEVERIMEQDQSLTTRVLRMVNSAYYAIPGGVKTVSRAVAYLGFDTVQQLVLSATIFSTLEHVQSKDFSLSEFWKHSIGTAMAAETLAKMVGHKNPPDLFTCGLVHDIGKVVLVSIEPEIFKEILEAARLKRVSFDEAEDILGAPKHAVLGQLLAKKWALPQQIQNSVRYHHQKDLLRRGGLTADANQAVDLVLLANLFIHGLNFGQSGHSQVISAPRPIFDRLGLNPKGLAQISKEIAKSLLSADAFLKVLSQKKDDKAA